MQQQRVGFICNQNQARSQVLSAVFSQVLPSHVFESFGLIAKENTPLPSVIVSVFHEWGLDPSGRVARNMALHRSEILNLNTIIAVTSTVAEEAFNLGFKGLIVDLEIEAALLGINIIDPQLMPRRQSAFELAKYLMVAYVALQNRGLIQNSRRIIAIIPERESSVRGAFEIARAMEKKNSVIVYGDLIAPRKDLIPDDLGPFAKYRFRNAKFEMEPFPIDLEPRILLPAHSVMRPPVAYLGSVWHNFLEQIDAAEITVVTPPMKIKSGLMAESYLAAMGASEIRVVK